jgi:hypothetical protein
MTSRPQKTIKSIRFERMFEQLKPEREADGSHQHDRQGYGDEGFNHKF